MLHRPAPAAPTRALAALLLPLLVLAGCAGGPRDPAASGGRADTPADAAADDHDDVSTVEVEISRGRDLVLVTDEGRTTVASIEDGELVDAAVRPARGAADELTVLALARTEGRYELRYVNLVAGDATDLYWFPFRLQVDPSSAAVADVPTLPVWAPDGSAVAWLEWTEDGTRLRTVGWLDHDAGTNPSDDQATYELAEVPVGSQLAAWEVAEDGTGVLVTRPDDGERWRIRLDDGGATLALDEVG